MCVIGCVAFFKLGIWGLAVFSFVPCFVGKPKGGSFGQLPKKGHSLARLPSAASAFFGQEHRRGFRFPNAQFRKDAPGHVLSSPERIDLVTF